MKRSFALVAVAWGLCAASALAQAPQIAARPVAVESYPYYDLAGTNLGPEQQSPEQAPVQAPAAEEEKAPCLSPSCCWFGHCGKMGPFGHCCWPCGCALSDLGEAWKLCKPHCEDSQWSTTGWI